MEFTFKAGFLFGAGVTTGVLLILVIACVVLVFLEYLQQR